MQLKSCNQDILYSHIPRRFLSFNLPPNTGESASQRIFLVDHSRFFSCARWKKEEEMGMVDQDKKHW